MSGSQSMLESFGSMKKIMESAAFWFETQDPNPERRSVVEKVLNDLMRLPDPCGKVIAMQYFGVDPQTAFEVGQHLNLPDADAYTKGKLVECWYIPNEDSAGIYFAKSKAGRNWSPFQRHTRRKKAERQLIGWHSAGMEMLQAMWS